MASTDARPIPIKNTAYRVIFPIFDNTGSLVTGAAGLDSEVSKDQGTFADCTNEATEIATASGMYYLDLTSTEMNADCVALIVKTSTTNAKTTPIVLYPAETGDIPVNVTAWNSTAVATPATAGIPDVNAKNINNVTAPTLTGDAYARLGAPVGASTSADIAAVKGVLPAALVSGRMDSSTGAMATDVLTAAALAASAVTEIQAGLSTYAGGDTSGTTTLLGRLTAIRAGLLDNLDAAISTRLASAGYTAPDNTTIGTINTKIGTPSTSVSADIATRAPSATALSTAQWTNTRAGNLDNLDTTVSSRLASGSYVAPDNAGITTIQANQTTINNNVLTRAPSATAVSNVDLTPTRAAKLDNLDTTVSSRSTLTAANVWAYVIEGALTAQGVFRLILASVANKLSGAATTTISIRDVADTKDRIVATVDVDGNRSSVTLDQS
jgi:hypothetical protein